MTQTCLLIQGSATVTLQKAYTSTGPSHPSNPSWGNGRMESYKHYWAPVSSYTWREFITKPRLAWKLWYSCLSLSNMITEFWNPGAIPLWFKLAVVKSSEHVEKSILRDTKCLWNSIETHIKSFKLFLYFDLSTNFISRNPTQENNPKCMQKFMSDNVYCKRTN